MKLIIISGRSGSGKSTVLNTLEDLGFHCIDNLPITLLSALPSQLRYTGESSNIAVCIDARSSAESLKQFSGIISELKSEVDVDIMFLNASDEILYRRYNETRRKHPLSNDSLSLVEAIKKETEVLAPIADDAQITIDTSRLTLQALRGEITHRIAPHNSKELALQFMSFGFKHGAPIDTDFVFDVRCLPNPYWDPQLRKYTGREQPIIDFLGNESSVKLMFDEIFGFIDRWYEAFAANNRNYLTIGIGCTGGQHRSVYLAEKLSHTMQTKYKQVQVRHRELPEA